MVKKLALKALSEQPLDLPAKVETKRPAKLAALPKGEASTPRGKPAPSTLEGRPPQQLKPLPQEMRGKVPPARQETQPEQTPTMEGRALRSKKKPLLRGRPQTSTRGPQTDALQAPKKTFSAPFNEYVKRLVEGGMKRKRAEEEWGEFREGVGSHVTEEEALKIWRDAEAALNAPPTPLGDLLRNRVREGRGAFYSPESQSGSSPETSEVEPDWNIELQSFPGKIKATEAPSAAAGAPPAVGGESSKSVDKSKGTLKGVALPPPIVPKKPLKPVGSLTPDVIARATQGLRHIEAEKKTEGSTLASMLKAVGKAQGLKKEREVKPEVEKKEGDVKPETEGKK